MNIRTLSQNVDNIEKTIEAFLEKNLTYSSACGILIEYGYSVKEAETILENASGQINGTNN